VISNVPEVSAPEGRVSIPTASPNETTGSPAAVCCAPLKISSAQKAALDRNQDGVRAVICIQLAEDAFHVRLNGVFRNPQLSRNDFVRAARRNRLQHFDFSPGE
jgi:hypothetical protein